MTQQNHHNFFFPHFWTIRLINIFFLFFSKLIPKLHVTSSKEFFLIIIFFINAQQNRTAFFPITRKVPIFNIFSKQATLLYKGTPSTTRSLPSSQIVPLHKHYRGIVLREKLFLISFSVTVFIGKITALLRTYSTVSDQILFHSSSLNFPCFLKMPQHTQKSPPERRLEYYL